ncbi:fibrinogen-like YCDxxxxGGGW domain-containing protein [Pseudoalteromonas sp. ASV78]|uniref:fibrinogen-like YCDxxxxGGGW domain-containing protein n=1 Tax=Pseudoalteromonas sp. ASV78 TaxID=3397851 RepID=UPI0039FBF3C1
MFLIYALSAISLVVSINSYATKIQFGNIEIDSAPRVLEVENTFSDPVLFLGLPTSEDTEPGVVSVHKTANQVTVRFAEWPYLDGVHNTEYVPYLVLEKGIHQMSDGSIWEVGTFNQSSNTQVQYFQQAFSEIPIVILSPQTQNESDPYSVRASSVTQHGFASRLFEQETGDTHAAETIAYLAIDSKSNTGIINEQLSYRKKAVKITSGLYQAPLGKIRLHEEQSKDSETSHVDETLGFLQINDEVFATDQSIYGEDTISFSYTPEYKYVTTEFSERNNIVLVGTNGLSTKNYSASKTYSKDLPSSAFDGYSYNTGILNKDATKKEARGTWISPANEPQWLEVNIDTLAMVTGIRVTNLSYPKRTPKDVVLQVSQNGVEYNDVQSFSLKIEDDTVMLASPAIGQYFRLLMTSNFGDSSYYKIDNVEMYGHLIQETNAAAPTTPEPELPEGPITVSCDVLHQTYPELTSGEYWIDPDNKAGPINPFKVYCDMETQGGGWTLFANHKDDLNNIATLPTILPSDFGVMETEKWQALRESMSTGFMFKDEHQQVSVLLTSTINDSDCRTPSMIDELDNIPLIYDYGTLWHYEGTGCGVSDLDYSLVILADSESSRNNSYTYQGASLIQYSSQKFDVWPYSSSTSRDEQDELQYFIK